MFSTTFGNMTATTGRGFGAVFILDPLGSMEQKVLRRRVTLPVHVPMPFRGLTQRISFGCLVALLWIQVDLLVSKNLQHLCR